MSDIPPFDQAVARYQDFLASLRLPGEIQWIFREDISVKYWGRTWVRVPIPAINLVCARQLYDVGRQRDIGVLLNLFCILNQTACCYVWIPNNEEEANRMLLRGLKLSVPNSPRIAKQLRRRTLVTVTHFLHGRTQVDPQLEDVPLRADCEFSAVGSASWQP